MKKSRATTEKAKNEKKEKLLKAGMDLLVEGDFPLPSVNQIIERASEAKGTFYLYFETKEELYLNAMALDFELFRGRLVSLFENKKGSTDKILSKEFFRFSDELPKIIYLAHITPLILENNVSDNFIVDFKKGLLQVTLDIAKVISERDGISLVQAKERFLISYNLFLGMRQHCVPPRHVQKLMEKHGLLELQYNFEKKFSIMMEKIWS